MAKDISPGDQDAAPLPWTGERFIPSIQGPIYYEHLHRYAFALELVAKRKCLDLACGEGFGSSLLSRKAAYVWGVDIDPACIAHASKKYQRKNLTYLQGSAIKIPLEDHSVDVVVSFETIEHFGEHELFMQEICRVLQPGGFLIISSPDKKEYTDKTGHKNSYHISELYHSEFEQLLKRYFSQVKLGRQRLAVGSYILSDEPDEKEGTAIGVFSGNTTGTRYEKGLADGVYSIAVCSNTKLPLIKYGLFEDPAFLGGAEALQARVNAENDAQRHAQELAGHQAAAENARHQVHALALEKDDAHRNHEEAKTAWNRQLLELNTAAEIARNQIDNHVLASDEARQDHEQAKVVWDRQLTELKTVADKAQNQIDQLVLEKNHAQRDHANAKAAWDTKLAELMATAESTRNQIDQLILGRNDAQRNYEKARSSWEQQLAGQKAAEEKARLQINQLILDKNNAQREHADSKTASDQQLIEHKASAEKTRNQINQLLLEKSAAQRDHDQSKAAWDQKLAEHQAAARKAQDQIDKLVLEKNDAQQDHEEAKLAWNQELSEQKAVAETAQAQIDQLIVERDEANRNYLQTKALLEHHPAGRIAPAKKAPRSWLKRTVEALPKPGSQKQETDEVLIAASGLFDEKFYCRMYPDVAAARVNPLEHYINHGRKEGRVPSEHFDSQTYLEVNPDLDPQTVDPIIHYIRHGRHEGRPLVSASEQMAEGILRKYRARKPAIVVVSHDGSRTGAPIIAYNIGIALLKQYDVIFLYLGSGPLLEAPVGKGALVLNLTGSRDNGAKANRLAAMLLKFVKPRFAIVNSVESRRMGAAFYRAGVPTLSLLHEFAAYTRPYGAFYDVACHSDATLFSTELTRDNALEVHPQLARMDLPIVPQGQMSPPPSPKAKNAKSIGELGLKSIRPANFPKEGIIVLGMGSVCLRKGVDLFLDCAARIKEMSTKVPIRFVWVGKGFMPPQWEPNYVDFLADQILRADLKDTVEIVEEMESVDHIYAESNIFLLTSRLDPLPNVAIDALVKGTPMICFDRTTGIADYLKAHDLGENCVARYLDTADMSAKLMTLAKSDKLRADIAARSKSIAARTYSMSGYIEKLVGIGEQKYRRRQEMKEETSLIAEANVLRADFVLPPKHSSLSPSELARHYIESWQRYIVMRKPFPGFHPGIYREVRGLAKGGVDPLADYLRSGQPEGPWRVPIITPGTESPVKSIPRTALHLHAYYPDMVPGIMDRLRKNKSRIDLYISVTSETNRKEIGRLIDSYTNGAVEVRVTPNVGRDLGPFLSCFAEIMGEKYDLVGHLHTKKSVHVESTVGEEWSRLLLENLLGGEAPMADIILRAMAADESLGIVFPDDPNVMSWDKNRTYADALAKRLKLPSLPEEINFPVGTMFWARVPALKALFDLKLSWDEYPKEPLPIDGTMLHAIERLLPLVVMASGRKLAVTNVPGVAR